MEIADFEPEQLGKKKIIGFSTLIIILLLAAGAGYAYSQIDISEQQTTFNTNATVFEPNTSNGTLEAGIATGERMSFGRFNAAFNKTKKLNLSAPSLTSINIETEGNISERLNYQERHLFAGEKQIPIEMEGNETGYFNGTIVLDMKTAQNKWGERWLKLQYNYF